MQSFEEILGSDIIEIHDRLTIFAKHHEKQGAIKSHTYIFDRLEAFRKEIKLDSPEGLSSAHGYEQGMKDALQIIRDNFIK